MLWQRLMAVAAVGMLIGLCTSAGIGTNCTAATISYTDQGPVGGISFIDISESSGTDPVPLFGPPDPFVVGLDFDPASFVSTANGGAADVTDGQVNFTIMSGPSGQINTLKLFESGAYSLTGTGNASTQALAGAIIFATVTQINGANVSPQSLTPVNGSVAFNLAANPGILQPWSLNLAMNIAGQVASLFGPNARATKVEVVIDNQLQALSQTSSLAFIDKKDFRIDIDEEVIPEPATLLMLLVGSVALANLRARA